MQHKGILHQTRSVCMPKGAEFPLRDDNQIELLIFT